MKKCEQTKALFLEQLKKSPIIEAACQKVGISRMTLSRWKREDKAFAKQIEEAILEGRFLVNDVAESQLISAVKDRNMPAIMYWLKHHHTDYRNRLELEGTINTIHELSEEQKELIKKALALANIHLNDHGDIDSK